MLNEAKGKILIFSKISDYSTDVVIDWILNGARAFIRINGESLVYEEKSPTLDEQLPAGISAVWFRRTFDLFNLSLPFELELHCRKECSNLYSYYYFNLTKNKEIFQLNKYEDASKNKLLVNKLAANMGLATPRSYIVNNKKKLEELLVEFDGNIIFKPLSEIFSFSEGSKVYISYTEKVSEAKLDKVPDFFLPSFIQQYIESEFEVRVVFLKGDFFSMAIFSALSAKTKTDFRNYDFTNMNRMVPFVLPKEIRIKLTKLVDQLDLNFCSIDFLYSKGEYYFLEVNPVGQFGMVSLPCNYNIEKRISEILIYEAENNS